MPIEPKTFDVSEHKFRFTPWSALDAVSEWGDIVADFGEGVLEHVLDGGDLGQIVASLQSESQITILTLQAIVAALGQVDLGERVGHYLTSGRVAVRVGDDWIDLSGADAGAKATEMGLDGLDLIAAAWHVVREGLRPLSDRLSSFERGPEKKSTAHSSQPEASA
jgi:hypothetical protein